MSSNMYFGRRVVSLLVAFVLTLGFLPANALAAAVANNSVVVSNTVPATMVAGTTYQVSVTLRNTGTSSWTKAAGYSLKAVGADPFTATTAYALAAADTIKTNATKTFTISMKAPATAGAYTTDWRMFKGTTAFGATFAKKVTVVPLALTSIAITTPATKLNYFVGDPLSLAGLVVTGTYNNGTKKVLPITAANVTGFSSAAPATGKTLTITYGGKTTTYKINVVAVTLSSIAITTPATKLNYFVGDPLSLAGLVVTGTYNNGTKKVLPITAANVTGFSSAAPATGKTLTITYGGKTTTYKINVVAVTLSSIAITTPASKLNYIVGDPLSLAGLVVTGTYNNGTKKVLPITAANVTGFSSAAPVTGQTLTITVGGKTTSYKINVVAVTLSSIAITTPATKLNYFVGDPLSLAGLVVTGTYNNGTTKALAITAANVTGFSSAAPVTGQTLTITVGGKTTTYKINVAAVTLNSIAITTPATKLNYFVGDPLSLAGLVVTGTYNNGTKKVLPITAANVTGFSSAAPATGQTLTITVGGKTTTYKINVAAVTLNSIAITTPATKLNYFVGDPLSLAGLVVTGTYNNGTTKALAITAANVTGFNSATPVTGQTLTITVGGKTTTYKVNILPIAVTGVAITGADTAVVGSTLQLDAVVTPSNATDKAITWSVATLSGGAATIDSTGLLTATAAGTVTVTATNGASGVQGSKVITIAPVDPVLLAAATLAVEGLEEAAAQDLTIEANLLAAEEAVTAANTQTAKLPPVAERTALEDRIAAATSVVTAARAAFDEAVAEAARQADAEVKVAAYEAALITTLALVADAEALKAPADAAVAIVTDATAKAAFEQRIADRAAAIADARAALEAEQLAQAAAETAVAAYEAAPIGTPDEITQAETLKAPAEAAVASVTDAAAKAAFQTRINNRAAAIETAKALIQSQAAARAAAETAVAAMEAAPLTNIAQINTANGLKTTAETKVSLVLDATVRNDFLQRITVKTIAMAIAELNLQTYFGSMEAALEKYNPVLGLDFTQYYALSNRAPVQTALLTPVFVTVADVKSAFDAAVAAQQAAEASPIGAFNNAASTADIAAAITTHAAALSLGLTEYNAIANKTPVHTELLGRTYHSGEEVRLAFIIAVMNYTNDAGVRTLLSSNDALLGLSQGYDTLSTKGYVEAAVIANKPIANKLEIVVSALSGTVNEWHIDQLLTLNKGLLGLDLSDYSAFEFRNKMKVQTAMIAATITSAADAQAAFQASVATQKAVETAGLQAFINAADTAAIATAITTYFAAADLGDYNGLMNKTPVLTELLIRSTFPSLVAVKTVLDAAAATEKALEATAMAAINNASTQDAMHAALLANAVTLGLNLSDYNAFPTADQLQVQNTMIAATFYTTSVLKTTFDTAVATQRAVITVNGADAAGMGAVLTANAATLGLNLSDYNLLTAASRDAVHAALVGRAFPDKASVNTALETAVSVPIINEITTEPAMATAITRYATVLGLNLTDYNALSTYKTPVQTALLAPDFATAADVKTAFDAAVAAAKEAKAVAAVNAAATAAAMHSALTVNASALGLNLAGYNALVDKVPVQTALLAPTFTTAVEVKAALDTAVAVQKVNETAAGAMGQALIANAAALGLDLADYTSLIYKEPVHAAMETPVFATAADVKAAFDSAVAAEKAYEEPLLTIPAVRLNKPAITLAVSASETLIATVLPYDAVNRDVTWATDNDSVATVDASGAVTAVGAGTATITVTAVDSGYTDTCVVTVVVPATGVTLNKTALILLIGTNETLIPNVLPAGASNKNVTWTSANPALVTVDANGKVTGVAAGVATNITVKTVDGSYTAICSVRAVTEATAVSAINNAIFTGNSMGNTIVSYAQALGLDLTDYNTLYTYEQSRVQMALLSPVFTSAAQIRTVFNAAVAVQVINITAEADLGAALTKYAATLGLDLTAYNQLSDKALVHTLLEPVDFTSAADIQLWLDEAVGIQQINLAAEAEIGAVLASNAALLGLDLSAYDLLLDKSPVDSALAAATFLSVADIQAALDAAVAAQAAIEAG